MKKIFFLFFFLLIPAQATLLWLKNYALLHGEILEYQDEKIIFKRWDNQGILEIPWHSLHPLSLESIQKKLGIVPEKSSEDMMSGVQVYLRNGGTILGILQEEKSGYLLIKNKNGNIPVPLSNILKKQDIVVSMAEIYKPEEIYQKFSQEYDLKTAKGNLDLAKALLRMENQVKARIHFDKAKTLQPDLSDQIQTLLMDVEKKASQSKQKKNMQHFHIYCSTNRYKKAFEILQELKNTIEENEWKKIWEETLEKQKEYFKLEITSLWMQKVSQKTGKMAYNRKISFQEAREYVFLAMPKEILTELSQELEITEQEVQSYFEMRNKNNLYSFSYHSGTFIVGTEGKEPEESTGQKRQKNFPE